MAHASASGMRHAACDALTAIRVVRVVVGFYFYIFLLLCIALYSYAVIIIYVFIILVECASRKNAK